MWIRAGGGRIIFTFYNIIVKSANVDKGGGAYPQNVDKKKVFFLNPSLIEQTLFSLSY